MNKKLFFLKVRYFLKIYSYYYELSYIFAKSFFEIWKKKN